METKKNNKGEAKKKRFDYKRIIKEGTPEERAAYFVRAFDLFRQGEKGKESLTKKQMEALGSSIKSKEEQEKYAFYTNLYFILRKYQGNLYRFVQLYKIGIGGLAKVIAQWEGYNKLAEALTTIFVDGRTEEEIQAELKKLASTINEKGVQYKYDPEKKAVVADIFSDGGFFEKIKEEQDTAKEFLSMCKACIVVIENFLSNYDCAFFLTPSSMEMSIENVKMELYSRSLIGKKYHMSELNHKRIDKGEPVTPEEELFAVVPDYYEVKPSEEFLEFCKNGLEAIRNQSN